MPTRPLRTYVSLKGDRGYTDLTFTGSTAYRLAPLVTPILEPDMTVHQTGKSAAVRIAVEGFQVSEAPEVSMPKVRAAFTACERLIRFYRRHRDTLDRAAAASVEERE